MNPAILLTASGTTAAARATYSHLDNAIRSHFPDNELLWSYASRLRGKKLQQPEDVPSISPEVVLRQLAAKGNGRVVVQSLHLLPGSEFHDLQRDIRGLAVMCAMGLPFLTSPADYDAFAEILRPIITARPGQAILLLGHGTTHPIWVAYHCLEKILRHKFGARIFVGVLEKFPDSKMLPSEMKAAGFSKVCIIPFLFIAGMHYHRDIVGDGQNSWMTRLQDLSLDVETIDHGLGLLPGMAELLIDHISVALKAFDDL